MARILGWTLVLAVCGSIIASFYPDARAMAITAVYLAALTNLCPICDGLMTFALSRTQVLWQLFIPILILVAGMFTVVFSPWYLSTTGLVLLTILILVAGQKGYRYKLRMQLIG